MGNDGGVGLISFIRGQHAFVSRESGRCHQCGNDERHPRHFCEDWIGARPVLASLRRVSPAKSHIFGFNSIRSQPPLRL